MNKLEIEVEFFSRDRGGRDSPPNLSAGTYRPHLTVDGRPEGEYLGVQFLLHDEELIFNQATKLAIELVYSQVDYSFLRSGATFGIMEGGKKVGKGKVL